MIDYDVNIRAFYDTASHDTIRAGHVWYPDALHIAHDISDAYGIRVIDAAGVIAALSPRIDWAINVRWAWRLVHEYVTHGTIASVSTNARRDAAIRVLNGGSVSGPKVTNFFRNIIGISSCITVDAWAARAAGLVTSLTDNVYADIEAAYIKVARELGIVPSTLQAIVWIAIRGKAD